MIFRGLFCPQYCSGELASTVYRIVNSFCEAAGYFRLSTQLPLYSTDSEGSTRYNHYMHCFDWLFFLGACSSQEKPKPERLDGRSAPHYTDATLYSNTKIRNQEPSDCSANQSLFTKCYPRIILSNLRVRQFYRNTPIDFPTHRFEAAGPSWTAPSLIQYTTFCSITPTPVQRLDAASKPCLCNVIALGAFVSISNALTVVKKTLATERFSKCPLANNNTAMATVTKEFVVLVVVVVNKYSLLVGPN